MKIIGIQNCINTNTANSHNKRTFVNAPQYKQISQYNPVYYRPAFTSSTTDKFTNLFEKGLKTELSKSELTQLSDYIHKIKHDVIYDQNSYIGAGTFGRAYRINNDYVLKIENEYYFDKQDRQFKYKERKFNNIPHYYGEVLATCYNLSILKNADPKGNAIISGKPMWMDVNRRNNYLTNVSLPAFAKLPQSSYDNYAKVLKYMNDNPFVEFGDKVIYSPDTCNTNNFMIVDNEIRFVDELHHNDPLLENDLCTMGASFLNENMTLFNPEENAKTINNKREIFKKCVLAAEETELPLLSTINNINQLIKIMNFCDYNMDEFRMSEFIDFINNIRIQEVNKDKRKQKIAEYLDILNRFHTY